MAALKLQCHCGKVTGVIREVTPTCGNRLICYCEDCRKFANHLNSNVEILNQFGGTEIFQIPPSLISIEQGFEHLACLRLTNKGLYRWHTTCCNTPVANTVALRIPFVGVMRSFMASEQDIAEKIGPVIGSIHREAATATLPDELKEGKTKIGILFAVISKLLLWKILRKGCPNPFFDDQGKSQVKPIIIKAIESK